MGFISWDIKTKKIYVKRITFCAFSLDSLQTVPSGCRVKGPDRGSTLPSRRCT